MTLFITVLGVVQGVGYRPFVARLAEELEITGTVKNSGGIVEITAHGSKEAADEFIRRLKTIHPPGSQILKVLVEPRPEQNFSCFTIEKSAAASQTGQTPIIPPDLPLCEECRRELYDKADRRYRYPFISCVSCGPRYSIINHLPYDRDTTTMEDFPMCPPCGREYTGSGRRRHAQTISCHDCGPQLILNFKDREQFREDALRFAIRLLEQGSVLAIKGIGGYQFACNPYDQKAVSNLRLLKRRDKKPFAVMFPNLGELEKHCVASNNEKELLLSPARPIVLLEKRATARPFCREVSEESRFLGAFLPYTPLHQLLLDECGPLVMTSGNLTGEPILYQDQEVLSLSSPYLDGVLYSTRRIVTPLDDSVARVVCGIPQLLRRSRGYVPLPLFPEAFSSLPILAMGGDLKAGFCLYKEDRAYLSQYFGDMEHYGVYETYENNLSRMERLFYITPKKIVCDLHPGYVTTRLAKELAQTSGLPLMQVQHHHAHIASVMAEYHLQSCIGVAFDGTGYGDDGAVWGGEFFLCQGREYQRAAHLDYVPLCGGDAAAKDAMLTAECYRVAAHCADDGGERSNLIQAAVSKGINCQRYSSAGRLFDAVSALLGLRTKNSYEGECAIALENAAASALSAGLKPFPLSLPICEKSGILILEQASLFRQIFDAVSKGAEKKALALGFHWALSQGILESCLMLRKKTGENRVALSGGVFSNLLLTENCVGKLRNLGFEVFINSGVPANDGGICLGQAYLAALEAEK